jgi:hypothetical protein
MTNAPLMLEAVELVPEFIPSFFLFVVFDA